MAERRQVIVDLITRTQGGTKGITNLKKDLGGVSTSAKGATKSIGKVGPAGANAGKGLKGLMSAAGGSRVAMGGMAAAGVAVGLAIKGSVQAFAQFDEKMNQSQAIMGELSEDQMAGMEEAARDVAKTTRLSADEAAESYFFLASAGLDANASIAALPKVAAFAQAGMFDMATATDLLTDAQSALGMTSDDAQENMTQMTKVSDIFVKSNQLANTSVQQVSEAITNKLGGSLRAAGIDLEEGVAVLAAFADQGLKGAAAGESMNIALRDLSRASRQNAEAFTAAGIEVFDQEGNFRNMADIIGDLEGAFGGLTAEQKANLASQLGFQDRSFKNIQLLLGTSDAVREYEKELRSAGGATEEVAENQLDSFSGQMDLLKSRLTDVGISIGEDLAPGLLEAASGFVSFVEAIGPAISLLGEFLGFWGDIFTAMGEGVNLIRSIFDDSADAAVAMDKAMLLINDAGEDGQKVYDALGNSIAHLAKDGHLSAEALAELGAAAGVSEAEMGGALATNLEFARANGFASDQIKVLNDALLASIEASDRDADSKQALIDKYELTVSTTDGYTDAAGRMETAILDAATAGDDYVDAASRMAGATGDAAGAAANAEDPFADLEEEVFGLEGALSAAVEAQASLADAMREFTDPTFAAASAIRDLQQAEEDLVEVNADVDASAQDIADAELDLFDATLKAQGAMDAFSATGIEGQVQVIKDVMGKSDEEARAFLEALGLIDGTSVTADATVVFNATGSAAAQSAVSSGTASSSKLLQFRAGGGPLDASQPSIVGESGPELFIPKTAGAIVPNDVLSRHPTQTTAQARTFGDINVIYPEHTGDDLVAGLQRATQLAALTGAAEGIGR